MKVYCNAGRSYVYGYPDGRLVQCESMFSHITIGNMIDCTWNPVQNTEKLICPDYTKCKGCDSYQSKQIIENNNGYNFLERNFTLYPRKEKNPNEFKDDYVMYMVTLNNRCNYDCIYCDWVERSKKTADLLEAKHVIKFFKMRAYEHKSTGFISIAPMGEPCIFPNFINVVSKLIEFGFQMNITSNMSKFEVIEELTSNKHFIPHLEFQMSLHPFAKGFNWDRYLGTVTMVRNRGFRCYSLMVGNPLQTGLFEKYKEELSKHNINLIMQEDESIYGKRVDEKVILEKMQINGNRKLENEIKSFKNI
jgi:MoaA/NifB/PqqE/SkfB family radical SAM enzyme